MAQIGILSWNIQVYGPSKYASKANGVALLNFIGAVAREEQANILVVHEAMSSVCEQVAFNASESLEMAAGGAWKSFKAVARPQGDRESYMFFWRTDAGFDVVEKPGGAWVAGLSDLPFPNNFSNRNGRAAAYVTFRTDRGNYFTATAYHAPPNARAIQGLEQLAKMPQLYQVADPPAAVGGRLLAGDYNLDVNVQQEYAWLKDPVPAAPPPAAAGQGAGCLEATDGDTELLTYEEAQSLWAGRPWSDKPGDYVKALAIDNIFWASPAQGVPQGKQGKVCDVIGRMMLSGTQIRQAAQDFTTIEAGEPAFPHGDEIQMPLDPWLNRAKNSFLLYRYAVSDHLPVFLSLTI